MTLASHTPATWTELLASTMHNIRGSFADNIFRKRPLLEHLLSAGRVRILDGGISFVEPLLYEVMTTSPDQFDDFIAAETKKWAKVIRDANLKVD